MTAPTPTLKVSVKPFKGELPKRKGPKERTPTPYDKLVADMIEAATKADSGTSSPMLAECVYSDPKQLTPIVNQLRSALKHSDTEGKFGLRTWMVDSGLVFQIGPKTVRTAPAAA